MSPRKVNTTVKRKSKQCQKFTTKATMSTLTESINEDSAHSLIKSKERIGHFPCYYPSSVAINYNEKIKSPITLTPHECSQYPSNEDFEAIVNAYLQNLSLKKRDKALVDHERYALILQVLKDPRNTAISTAQFRFWVKKMFRLGARKNTKLGTEEEIVCHDNKPVAVREDIYYILILAHKEAQHGGRDKTSAIVRRRYSWIPKELIARFVRHCPFCISRRNNMCMHPHEHNSECLTSNKNDDMESVNSDIPHQPNLDPYFLPPQPSSSPPKIVKRKRRRQHQRLTSFPSSPPWKKHNHQNFDNSNYLCFDNDPVAGFSMAATVATSAAVAAVAAAAAAAAAAPPPPPTQAHNNHFIPSPESLAEFDYITASAMAAEEECAAMHGIPPEIAATMFDYYYNPHVHQNLISPPPHASEFPHHDQHFSYGQVPFDLFQNCFPSEHPSQHNNDHALFTTKEEEELIYLLSNVNSTNNDNDAIAAVVAAAMAAVNPSPTQHSSPTNTNYNYQPPLIPSDSSSVVSASDSPDSAYLLEQLLRQQDDYQTNQALCPPLGSPKPLLDGSFDQQLLMLSAQGNNNFVTSVTATNSSPSNSITATL